MSNTTRATAKCAVVSIRNILGGVSGLDRVWSSRYQVLKDLNCDHYGLVLAGDASEHDNRYLETLADTITFMTPKSQSSLTVTTDRLVKDHLLKLFKEYDGRVVVIDDNPHNDLPVTMNLCMLSRTPFYKFIHYDVTNAVVYGHGGFTSLRKDVRYLVCNSYIANQLSQKGVLAENFPAIFVDTNQPLANRENNGFVNYLMVGGANPVKRVDIAIEAFERLYKEGLTHSTLSIYGELRPELEGRVESCPLISYHGHVEEVPYHAYDGYISSSETEAFANACVEASGSGLDLILRDNPCHRGYLEYLNRADSLFVDSEALFNLLNARAFGLSERVESKSLSNLFSKDSVTNHYKKILNFD